jgi:hypothetical protein
MMNMMILAERRRRKDKEIAALNQDLKAMEEKEMIPEKIRKAEIEQNRDLDPNKETIDRNRKKDQRKEEGPDRKKHW